ncbi:MAG: hypothetical protein JO352_31605 [Chloroflexi bacterium]|nr:hypothetical protein [Chloroflexota bacterium]
MNRSRLLATRFAYMALLFCLGLAFAVFSVGADTAQAQSSQEEFVGPFGSWRQVQCAGGDDTALLQNELNSLGRSGSPVLYIRPGTCRITSTLHLGQGAGGADGVHDVTILGQSPADTRIVWGGPAGRDQKMFEVKGVAQSRFGRMTWDGGDAADIVYYDDWPNAGNFFPSGNRHEDEVFQHLWSGGGIAFDIGAAGAGGSEWEYVRCKFIGPMEAGIYLSNFNALDHWVWDSLFQNVQAGITNYLPDRGVGAGGAWDVSHSVFLNNGDDLSIANAAFFSSRWNYSRGSQTHVHGYPIGPAASPWTSQSEVIIDPSSTNPAFTLGTSGPLGLFDDTIRNGPSGTAASLVEGYEYPAGGDLWSFHNTLSATGAPYTVGDPPGSGRMQVGSADRTGQAITDPGPPQLPTTPPMSKLPVLNVHRGDIAGALAQAGNNHVVVHIPYGTYHVAQTLEVGPNTILTGDGFDATVISSTADPVLHVAGPSHATLRDFSVTAFDGSTRLGSGIAIDNADQPGGLVHSEDWMSSRNDVGWEVTNLANTVVDSLDSMAGENKHADENAQVGAVDYKVTAARLHVFNGAGANSDVEYEVHQGELVAEGMFFQGEADGGTPERLVAAGSSGTLVLDTNLFASDGGIVDTTSFRGLLTLVNTSEGHNTPDGRAPARAFGPNSLILGYEYGWTDDATPPRFTRPPYALLLGRHNTGQGGTDLINSQAQVGGVGNLSQFIQQHLAPLGAARPVRLQSAADGVTNVHLYRVGASLVRSGIRVLGSAADTTGQR